jgi:hypothetical protein
MLSVRISRNVDEAFDTDGSGPSSALGLAETLERRRRASTCR